MLSFGGKHWSEIISEVTSQPQFQTATVRLEDPSILVSTGDIDPDTWEETYTGDPVIYEGPARIVGVRWGVGSGGESQANSKTLKAIRVQFPPQAVGRVKKACVLYVTECERNPVLTEFAFVTTNDFQGSSAATRTIEFSLDGDVEVDGG